jgi:hypothetical protein
MNIKRNIFITALCIVFLLNISASLGVAASSAAQEQQASSEEKIIKALGFAQNIPGGDRVSYYEWAQFLLELRGISTNGMKEKTPVDTAIEDGYIYNIVTAQQKPDDEITIREALYGGVCALGYGYLLSEEQVVNLAVSGGLKKGISQSDSDYVTRDVFFKIAYNICNANYMELEEFKNGSPVYTTKNNETILSKLHGIYTDKGRVTANSLTGLYTSTGAAGKDSVKIDDTNYYCGETEAEELLGREVKYWYSDKNGEFTLLYIETTDDDDVIEIDADDINAEATTKTKIVYTVDGRDKYKTIKKDTAVIYNGVAYPAFDNTTFAPQDGTVKIIGDDVVMVWSYIDFWINEHDTTENTLTTFLGEELTLDPYDEKIKVFDKDMSSGYVVDIRKFNVISVAESADKSSIRIIRSDTKVSGTISEIGEEDGKTYITVDGNDYKVSSKYENSTSRKKIVLSPGKNVTIYLDVFGTVCGVENTSGAVSVGYVLNAVSDEGEETAWIKMFIPEDGSIVTYQCADKVVFDNSEKVKPNGIQEKFADTNNEFSDGRNIKRQLIAFSLDSNGKISKIDLPSAGKTGEREDSLRCMYNYSTDGGKLFYRSQSQSAGGKFLTSGATVFLATAKDSAPRNEDFAKTTIGDNKSYCFEAYSLDQNGLYADYIVVYPETSINPVKDRTVLVNKVTTKYDEKEDEVNTYLEGVLFFVPGQGDKTEEGSIAVDESYVDLSSLNLSEGDIVECGVNSRGKAIRIRYVYDYSEKRIYDQNGNPYNGNATNSWGGENRLMVSSVLAKDGSCLEVRQGTDAGSTEPTEYLYIGGYSGIAVFDKDLRINKTHLGSASDIRAYEDTGEYSIIVNTTYWGEARNVVVYK